MEGTVKTLQKVDRVLLQAERIQRAQIARKEAAEKARLEALAMVESFSTDNKKKKKARACCVFVPVCCCHARARASVGDKHMPILGLVKIGARSPDFSVAAGHDCCLFCSIQKKKKKKKAA